MIMHIRTPMKHPIDERVVALQSRIFAGRLKLHEVLNRAGVPRSTWWRWVNGGDARRETLLKIDAAISAKLLEKDSDIGPKSGGESPSV